MALVVERALLLGRAQGQVAELKRAQEATRPGHLGAKLHDDAIDGAFPISVGADTRFVVIDPQLKENLRKHTPVPFRTLLQGSVQIWANKIDKLALQPLTRHSRSSPDIYSWDYEYDPDFLGYMKGVLKREEFLSAGGAII